MELKNFSFFISLIIKEKVKYKIRKNLQERKVITHCILLCNNFTNIIVNTFNSLHRKNHVI